MIERKLELEDTSCPNGQLLSDDILNGSPFEWRCALQPEEWGDISHGGLNENKSYKKCEYSKKEDCPFYKK